MPRLLAARVRGSPEAASHVLSDLGYTVKRSSAVRHSTGSTSCASRADQRATATPYEPVGGWS